MWNIIFAICWMIFSAIVLLAEMGWWSPWPNDHSYGKKSYWRLSVFGMLFLLWTTIFLGEMGVF